MRNFKVLAAVVATVLIGGVATAGAKPQQPKQRKICRTVEVSGRVTPQRICRKVERPAAEEESQRKASDADETSARRD
ncbi:MAG: hypothetical protein QOG72_1026 [Sphingomonadales bacterium]|nr:hypothetical protein [Sphingomonadales bacterium]